MAEVNSYGVIQTKADGSINVVSSSNDFVVKKVDDFLKLTFSRDVSKSVVVATYHTGFCDVFRPGEPIQIGKDEKDNGSICIFFPGHGFSFMLIG